MPEPTTAPVTAEDLRERIEAALRSTWDGQPTHMDDAIRIETDAVMAVLADDPGDLPARMQAVIHDAVCNHVSRNGTACADCRTAAAMSVRWEDHAATEARLDHALAELSSLRDHRARWETEKARADAAERERDESRARWYAAHEQAVRELEDARIDLTTAQGQLTDERAHSKRAYEKLAVAEAEVERLRAELAKKESDVELGDMKIGELNRIMLRLQKRAAEYEAERDALKAERDRMQHLLKTLVCTADVLAALAVPETPGDAEEATDE